MSLFGEMLGSEETIFKNPVALEADFVPKLLPHRENEQFAVASCIKPLFNDRNGRNAVIVGSPGIGKTAACRHILRELEEQTEEIYPIFVSCWKKNSSYKVMIDICEQLGYRLTHNKRTDELFSEIKRIVNKKSAVFIFDEIDKADEYDFLYMILEEIYKRSVILITNFEEWAAELDDRIKSRLVPEIIEFKPYTLEETRKIISERVSLAFFEGVFDDDSLSLVAQKANQVGDIRTGLFLLKESANLAEDRAKKKVGEEEVRKAIEKLSVFKKRKADSLDDDSKAVVGLIKNKDNSRIGDLFKEYQKDNPNAVYKTFQRKISKLSDDGFITVKKITGGKEGTTTVVSYVSDKRLTDF